MGRQVLENNNRKRFNTKEQCKNEIHSRLYSMLDGLDNWRCPKKDDEAERHAVSAAIQYGKDTVTCPHGVLLCHEDIIMNLLM